MKGLKRYGGTFDESGRGANQNVGIFGVICLIGGVGLSIYLKSPGLLIVGFLLLFLFTVISELVLSQTSKKFKFTRHKESVIEANKCYENKDYNSAHDHYRRASIYQTLTGTDLEKKFSRFSQNRMFLSQYSLL